MSKTNKKITLGEVDFDTFKIYLETVIEQKLEEKQVLTKKDLKYLPTKDEFFERMDKLSKEIEDSRQEKAVEKDQVSSFNERISALEDIHPDGHHVVT